MTLVQILERTRQECGIAGSAVTTIVGLNRELTRLLGWIQQGYVEIQQEEPEWDFMRKSVTFNTVASQQTYHVGTGLDIDVSDFGHWRNDSFRSYLTSAGVATEVILSQYYSYSEFRDFYLLGSRRLVTGRPLYITINPADRALLLGFTPNDDYTVSAEYFCTPDELTTDSDEPIFPARYHMLCVYKAMQKYGLFEAAQEQIEAGKTQYSMLLNKMTADQTPMLMQGDSLI